jgi:glycosyltransferase involved in cell wall biosynthesis
MKVSIIVPVYNESSLIKAVVERLYKSECPIEREWIFVDDCSTDGSLDVLKSLQVQLGFLLLQQPTNQGKGAAVIRGIKQASGDFVIIQDADFEYDPDDIPSLLEPLIGNKADVVFGSRFKKNSMQVHRTFHYFINRFLTFLSNIMSGIYLTDMETCYKVFRRDLIQSMNLTSNRFGIEVELTSYLAKTNARIFEIPIRYYPRTKLQGKKINWKDGIAALFHLYRFNYLININEAFTNLPEKYLGNLHNTELKKR